MKRTKQAKLLVIGCFFASVWGSWFARWLQFWINNNSLNLIYIQFSTPMHGLAAMSYPGTEQAK